ncbi:hypothetical protein CMMCAS05_01135 [Clavibacter michiganensis subsp. michiganensis]|nr:hypothetical protein CMMCAS05_01135 [Clavibacter michiganensis subsp. michiganensis]
MRPTTWSVLPSTATWSTSVGKLRWISLTVHAVLASFGGVISTRPVLTLTPRATRRTSSKVAGSTAGVVVGAADAWWPACGSAAEAAPAPVPGSAVVSVGVCQLSAARRSVTFCPPNCDHVMPVADRNSAPATSHTPVDACQESIRR